MKFKLSLPKKIWLAVGFMVAIAFVFIAQVSFATPKPQQERTLPEQPQSYEDSPCYFQTQQGTTLDLSKLCGATTPPSEPTVSRQPSAQRSGDYNYGRIKDFDDSLYGKSDEVYGQQ
jgi:hypothetical protein